MAKKARKRPVPPHGKVMLASVVAVAVSLIAGMRGGSLPGTASVTDAATQNIALEHGAPVTLSMVIAEGREPGIVDLWHDGTVTHRLTVPATWELREVKNATLADVAAQTTGEFRRMAFPAGAHLSFIVPPPDAITLHNSSRGMMQVKWKRVNVDKGTVREETMLVKSKALRLR